MAVGLGRLFDRAPLIELCVQSQGGALAFRDGQHDHFGDVLFLFFISTLEKCTWRESVPKGRV